MKKVLLLIITFMLFGNINVSAAESITNSSKYVGNFQTQPENPDTSAINWMYDDNDKYAIYDDGTKEYWRYDNYGYIEYYVKIYPNADYTLIAYPNNTYENKEMLYNATFKWDFEMAQGKSYAGTSVRYEYDANREITQKIIFTHTSTGTYENETPFESAIQYDYNASGQRTNTVEYTYTQQQSSASCDQDIEYIESHDSDLDHSIMDHVQETFNANYGVYQCTSQEVNYDYFSPGGKVSVKQTMDFSSYAYKSHTEKIEYNQDGKRITATVWYYNNNNDVTKKDITNYNSSGYKTNCNSRVYNVYDGLVETNIDYTYYTNNNKVHTKTTTNYEDYNSYGNQKTDAVANTYNSSGYRTQGTTYDYYYKTSDVETKTTTNYDGDTKTSATKTEYHENGEKYSSAAYHYYSTNAVKQKDVTYYDNNVAYMIVTNKYDKYGTCTYSHTEYL